MKTKQTLLIAAFVAASLASVPLRAAGGDDDRIVSTAKDSYVYRTYLKDDDIKIKSQDGVVTLTGQVADRSHKSMAADTVENLPGVKNVDNQIAVKPANEQS